MVSIQVLATPIRGRLRSASVNPMALNMERAPARSRPSVIPRLMCLRSIVKRLQDVCEPVKRLAQRPRKSFNHEGHEGSLRKPHPSKKNGEPAWQQAPQDA